MNVKSDWKEDTDIGFAATPSFDEENEITESDESHKKG